MVYVLTLRSGQPWDDDFALYILHARNLVEGRAYGDTGYLYNPAAPMYSPAVYPPGFALLLAPLYALFGTNLFALRMVVVASVVASVAVFAALVRPVLPPRLVLAAAALVGFQPFFVRFKNLLLPDFTFLLFVLLSLWLVRRLHEDRGSGGRQLGIALLAGACIYMAISLRIVGIALLAGLVLYHALRLRLPSVPILVCAGTALLLWGVQSSLMPPASGYAAQWSDITTTPSGGSAPLIPWGRLRMVRYFFASTDILWSWRGELNAPPSHGITRLVVLFLMFVTPLLAAIGYVLRLKRLTIVETFVIPYLGAVLIGGMGARYLIPVIPLLFYYAVLGITQLTARGGRAAGSAALGLAMIVSVIYLGNLIRVDRSPYMNGVTGPASTELFNYIRECTPEDARFVAHRPRALALYTARAAMLPPDRRLEDDDYVRFIDSSAIDYVVSLRNARIDLATMRLPAMFTSVFQNERFAVYANARRAARPVPVTAGCVGG